MLVNPELEKARQNAYALQAEAQQVQADYDARMEAIRQDANLSQTGKNSAIKTLLTEQRAKIDGLVSKLRRAAVAEAVEADVSQGVRNLVKREYSNWDYGRLAYEANRVKSAFVLAGGKDDGFGGKQDIFAGVMDEWQRVKERGDKYEIKAWMDNAPAIMPQAPELSSYAKQTRQSIIEDIAASEVYTLTDEGKKFETERAERVKNLEIIAGATVQVSKNLAQLGTFDRTANGEAYMPGRELQRNQVMPRVFDGIVLDRESGELRVDRVPGEKAEQMYNRTESAFQETVKQIETVTGEKIDALVYGVS